MRDTWETSSRYLGDILETSGRHLGDIHLKFSLLAKAILAPFCIPYASKIHEIIKNGSPGRSRRHFGTRSTKRPKNSLFIKPFGNPLWNENPPKAALERPKGVLEHTFSPPCAHARFFHHSKRFPILHKPQKPCFLPQRVSKIEVSPFPQRVAPGAHFGLNFK